PAAREPRPPRRLVDGADRRRADRARRVRRVDPVRRPVDTDHHLARAGRGAARRGHRHPGGGGEYLRGRRRRGRDRRRLVDLLRSPGESAAPMGAPRARVPLRRAVHRPFLRAGVCFPPPPRRDDGGADRQWLDRRCRRPDPPRRHALPRAPDRARARLRVRARSRARRPRPRLHRGQMTSHGWITTTMIMLPLIAAGVIWIVPMPRVWVAPAALLVSLFEVGFWIEALVRYDFDRGGLQEWNHATWLKDLGVSYSVGFYQGFSVWLVGLTAVVMAAAIAYGYWMGRDRPRAYYGLM